MKRLLALLVVTFLVLFGIGLALYERPPTPTVVEEGDEEREQSIREAFAGSRGEAPADAVDEALVAELTAFFHRLRGALDSADQNRIEELFSTDATLRYAEEAGLVDLGSISVLERVQFKRGFRSGFLDGICSAPEFLTFDEDFELVRVEPIRDGEVVVFFRATNSHLQVTKKMRYWLIRSGQGDWTAYDFEDLDAGMRLSALMGVTMQAANESPDWLDDFVELGPAVRRLFGDDPQEAIVSLQEHGGALVASEAPALVRAFGHQMLSTAFLVEGEFGAALEQADRALALDDEAPVLVFMRGNCLTNLGRYEEALEAFRSYARDLGYDSDLYEFMAVCHLGLDEPIHGRRMAEEGLALSRLAYGCMACLAVCLADNEVGEIEPYLSALSPEEHLVAYEVILDFTLQEGAKAAFQWTQVRLEWEFPEHELVAHYREASADTFGE